MEIVFPFSIGHMRKLNFSKLNWFIGHFWAKWKMVYRKVVVNENVHLFDRREDTSRLGLLIEIFWKGNVCVSVTGNPNVHSLTLPCLFMRQHFSGTWQRFSLHQFFYFIDQLLHCQRKWSIFQSEFLKKI